MITVYFRKQDSTVVDAFGTVRARVLAVSSFGALRELLAGEGYWLSDRAPELVGGTAPQAEGVAA
jgi:hypothetical protein